jgi:hypothetical protein
MISVADAGATGASEGRWRHMERNLDDGGWIYQVGGHTSRAIVASVRTSASAGPHVRASAVVIHDPG